MKSTKKSLLLSTLSLIMCVAMLLGTTYAWFTDSVTSGKNKIIAGNLDVELYANGTKVDGDTKLFSKVALWEPGAVAFDTLQVKNVGNLALKYQLSFLFENETKVDGHGLSEVLKIGTYADTIDENTKREDVIANLTDVAPIASFAKSGNLAANTEDTAVTYVVYWEPGDNDNLYNMNNEKKGKELSIDFYVKLVATQDTVETDSFDKNYDIEAPWLGGVGELPEAKDGVIEIASAEQLAALSSAADSAVSGKTVKLVKDIDLNNIEWKPVTKGSISWTFDGNSHTILNLKVTSNQRGNGLFSWCPGLTVKNLTVDGAKISGTGMDGVIAGNGTCVKVDNCTVKNAEVISNPNIKDAAGDNNGDKSGIIVGYLCADPSNASITNCVVEDCTLQGYRDIGAVTGIANGTAKVTGNKVKNVTIINDRSNDYKGYDTDAEYDVNEVVGETTAAATVDSNTATGITMKIVHADGLIQIGNIYEISKATGLAYFASMVNTGNTFEGKMVKLIADIDLAGIEWTPIGDRVDGSKNAKPFAGTFDGQDHKITNLSRHDSVDNAAFYASGLFGFVGKEGATTTIKNLSIDRAEIIGRTTGILIGETEHGNFVIDNIKITNATITGQQKNGGIIGNARYCDSITLTNCTVENLKFNGLAQNYGYQSAGLIGCVYIYKNSSITVSDNTVKNITIKDAVDTDSHPLLGQLRQNDVKTGETFNTFTISNNTITDCSGFNAGATDYCGSRPESFAGTVIYNGVEQ